MKLRTSLLLLAAVMLSWPQSADADTEVDEVLCNRVITHYADLVHAVYSDALAGAKELRDVVEHFIAEPTEDSLAKCREKWIGARKPYLHSEVFRFYGGPIDGQRGPEGVINAWPIDEAWIESGDPARPGLIEDFARFSSITPAGLRARNQKEGEKNVSCGWHAIEFLLWGKDVSADAPGRRPAKDFTDGPYAARRCEILWAASTLLVEHLAELLPQWEAGMQNNYRARFVESPKDAIRCMLTGMFFLAGHEMAGERMNVALETQDQEDEHSCFSDTTHLDLIYNFDGIKAVWTGRYEASFVKGKSINGPSLKELTAAPEPAISKAINAALGGVEQMLQIIPAPFDQAIRGDDDSEGRRAILESVGQLETLGAHLSKLADALEVRLENQAANTEG